MQFCTTSKDIADWRQTVKDRLLQEPEYAKALELDSSIQRQSEEEWLSDPAFNEYRCPVSGLSAACIQVFVQECERNALALFSQNEASAALSLQNNARPAPTGAGLKVFRDEYFSADALIASLFLASDIMSTARFHSLAAQHNLAWLLSDLRRLGGESEKKGGAVSIADLAAVAERARGRFLLKSPVSPEEAGINDLRHEAIVALFGTNALRTSIPNFPFVYAYCRGVVPEYLNSHKSFSPRRQRREHDGLQSWTLSSKAPLDISANVPFLITEDIGHDTQPLSETIGEIGMHTFYPILIQIVYALKHAYEQISFTHYDLAPENVLLKKMPNDAKAYIPYERDDVFVYAQWIVLFTGCGFAHIQAKNVKGRSVSFGFAQRDRAELVEYGIFRDRTNPMTDVYRFLLKCAECALPALKTDLEKLLKYFNNKETLAEVLEQQRDNMYYLPLTTSTRVYNFSDFLAFAKKEARSSRWGADPVKAISAPLAAPAFCAGADFFQPFCAIFAQAQFQQSTLPLLVRASPQKGLPVPATDAAPEARGGAKPPSLATPFAIPRTFTGFFDIYSYLLAYADVEKYAFTIKNFTAAYMSGFSEQKGAYHQCIAHALAQSRLVYATLATLAAPPLVSPSATSEAITREIIAPAPLTEASLKKLAGGKAGRRRMAPRHLQNAPPAAPSTSTQVAILDLYAVAEETYRAFLYASTLYWSDAKQFPDDVEEARLELQEGLCAMQPLVNSIKAHCREQATEEKSGNVQPGGITSDATRTRAQNALRAVRARVA